MKLKENSTIWRSVLRGLAWSWLLITIAYISIGVAIGISYISKTLPHDAYIQQVFFCIAEPFGLVHPLKLLTTVVSLLPTVFLFWLSGIGKKKQDKDI